MEYITINSVLEAQTKLLVCTLKIVRKMALSISSFATIAQTKNNKKGE